MKLLIGSLTWCPKEFDDRAEQHCRYLQLLSETVKENEDCSWLIIDNNSDHPLVVEALAKYAAEATVIINLDNYGWPVARNQMIGVFKQGDYELLAMQDCDEFLFDKTWPVKVKALYERNPKVIGYGIRANEFHDGKWKSDRINVVILPSNIIVDVYREHLGTTTIVDHKVIDTIGGYDWQAIPCKWGFHDPEYGRRLLKSGLLAESGNKYVDPIRMKDSKRENCETAEDNYYKKLQPYRETILKTKYATFLKKEAAVMNGEAPLFFDYNLRPPEGFFEL